MAKIKQMGEALANMIAAGEVIDRPASVIKELVENAIDAKATIIKIEIENFGLKVIKVTDNGSGMGPEDAVLAFYRHATSKIKSADDLNHINSLGFRGEALPSIASVSKVTLVTKEENGDGTLVLLHGGEIVDKKPTAANKGTSISVNDLFYNTPARFKYIKSEVSEKNAIVDFFDYMALSNPGIAFSLYIDGKLYKETYGTDDYHSLIAQIYGNELTNDLSVLKRSYQKTSVRGYLVNPQFSRSRNKDVSIFLNGRYIKNYTFTKAVVEGYQGYLMTGRFPIAIIYIDIDPSLVDVNVHPQKLEVKLVNEYLLSFQLTNFIKETFTSKTFKIVESKTPSIENVEVQSLDLQIGQSAGNQKIIVEETKEVKVVNSKLPNLEYIGVLGGTYLLFQNEEGLYLMDQHAAAERIRYETIIKNLSNPEIVTKKMLIPIPIPLSINDIEVVKINKKLFTSVGFSFTTDMRIDGIPTWIKDAELSLYLEQMITSIQADAKITIDRLVDATAKSIACKGAIKANKAISRMEIENLLKELATLNNPYNCPHGRPTLIKVTYNEVEKMFKRIV